MLPRRLLPPPRPAGFTLVEVLVAMFILSVVALMAWQGLDGLVRTRDGAQARAEQSLQTGNALAQWQADLQQLQRTAVAPTLAFDGSALRLTRQTPQGLQVVVWTVQEGRWWRWASPATARAMALRQAWEASQVWARIAPQALVMQEGVSEWQVYFFRSGDNAWSNAQSSEGTVAPPPGTPAPPLLPPGPGTSASGAEAGGDGTPTPPAGNPAAGPPNNPQALPAGVRLRLRLPAGELTRDLTLPPAP